MDDRSIRPRRHFTLIELLVVVAIIAVLAAMLMPALNRARGMAQSTVCMNNHKQMMLAATLYADENENWLPLTGRFSAGWMIHLAPYIGEFRPNMHYQITRPTAPDKYYATFRCPTNFEKPRKVYYYGCYGYNIPMTSTTAGGSSDPTHPFYTGRFRRPMDRVKDPSRVLLTSDSFIIGIGSFGNLTSSALSANPQVQRNHVGYSLNMSFLDGSAQNLTYGERKDLALVEGKITGWSP